MDHPGYLRLGLNIAEYMLYRCRDSPHHAHYIARNLTSLSGNRRHKTLTKSLYLSKFLSFRYRYRIVHYDGRLPYFNLMILINHLPIVASPGADIEKSGLGGDSLSGHHLGCPRISGCCPLARPTYSPPFISEEKHVALTCNHPRAVLPSSKARKRLCHVVSSLLLREVDVRIGRIDVLPFLLLVPGSCHSGSRPVLSKW